MLGGRAVCRGAPRPGGRRDASQRPLPRHRAPNAARRTTRAPRLLSLQPAGAPVRRPRVPAHAPSLALVSPAASSSPSHPAAEGQRVSRDPAQAYPSLARAPPFAPAPSALGPRPLALKLARARPALRRSTLFARPGLFGRYLLGSPSLPLAPALFDEEEASAEPYAAAATAAQTAVLIVCGEAEAGPRGNGIPGAAQRMADVLKRRGLRVGADLRGGVVLVRNEDHGSLKPALVSQGVGWLERHTPARAHPPAR